MIRNLLHLSWQMGLTVLQVIGMLEGGRLGKCGIFLLCK
jgi:hypothetical protein